MREAALSQPRAFDVALSAVCGRSTTLAPKADQGAARETRGQDADSAAGDSTEYGQATVGADDHPGSSVEQQQKQQQPADSPACRNASADSHVSPVSKQLILLPPPTIVPPLAATSTHGSLSEHSRANQAISRCMVREQWDLNPKRSAGCQCCLSCRAKTCEQSMQRSRAPVMDRWNLCRGRCMISNARWPP